ncbi:psuG [Symbiodinium natans]|uniref:PsuG protein n=1 Tax=Symbiodinium natans TaxID=878477 RepID=A0A812S6S1_9DINO|nr:psuG [Symbiodinium natans]
MDLPDHGLQCTLRSVLLNADTNGLNDILGQEFVGSLLAEEQIVSTEYPAEAETTRGAKQSWGPVLDRPYATSLAAALEHCIREGYFLRPPLPENDGLTSLLVEDGDEIARWQDCVESMRGTEMCSLVSTLSCLGRPGIRLALGQRRTVGSLDVLPPSRHELIQSFSALHKEDTSESCAAAPGPHRCEADSPASPGVAELEEESEVLRSQIKALAEQGRRSELDMAVSRMKQLTKMKRELLQPPSMLSVGARALAKHAHRGMEGFWAVAISGSDAAKNRAAEGALQEVLREAVWGNLHQLPGGLPTFEVRVKQGYGARWTVSEDGSVKFRGLLEPMMEDGHEKRWRH